MNPWRYECPKGHRDLWRRKAKPQHNPPEDIGNWWYCKTCDRRYDRAKDCKTGNKVSA